MGKTSLALDICAYASSSKPDCGFLSYFFSLEMSSEEISARLLSKLSGVNLKNLRTADLSETDINALSETANDMVNYKLVIDDSPTLTPATIKAKIMERQALYGEKPDIIFVDYLQLMAPSQAQNSREREVASMSRDLKLLARELNVPVVVMSQLNRDLEKRPNKRPIMADIRESGAVEQDADLIVALYQPFLYSNNENDMGKAEAVILKQRNGPIGTVHMVWKPETSSFAPMAGDGFEVRKNNRRSEPKDSFGGMDVEYTYIPPTNDKTSFPETANNQDLPF
jgi:replicative DNA helicase